MVYNDLHSAYLGTLADIYDNPQFKSKPRGQSVREVLNYRFVIKKPIVGSVNFRMHLTFCKHIYI